MKTRTTTPSLRHIAMVCAAFGATLSVGCGDESTDLPLPPSINDAEPKLLEGGGIGSGAIKGKLNVYAIDAKTKAPIANADVRVGEADDAEPLVGKTDATGLITFKDAKLEGPTSITITAGDHIAASWLGVNGANVTIPLDPTNPPPMALANAEGTIEGWDALPTPAAGHITIGFVGYSWTGELGGGENDIKQPSGGMGIDPNACIKVMGQAPPCAWKLITRTGKQAHYAIILDVDTKNTMDQADDAIAVIGYAFLKGLDIAAGTTSTGEVLKMFPTASIVDATITLPTPPTGLENAVAIPLLDIGDDGKLPLFLGPLGGTPRLPLPTDILTGGKYEIIARAIPNTMGVETPSTVTITKDVDISKEITLPAFQSPPADLVASGGTYSFKPATGATVHNIGFLSATSERVWGITLFDSRTSFSLPTLTPDPLPSGSNTMAVSAITIPSVDLQDFLLNNIKNNATALSENAITFTH